MLSHCYCSRVNTIPSLAAYDDLDLRDPYYADHYRSGTPGPYSHRRNSLSRSMSRTMSRTMSRSMSRSLSRMGRQTYGDYRGMSSGVIKFKRKGGFRSGITLGEAMSDAHLSGNDDYDLYYLNADARGRIILKVRVRLSYPI